MSYSRMTAKRFDIVNTGVFMLQRPHDVDFVRDGSQLCPVQARFNDRLHRESIFRALPVNFISFTLQ